MNRFIVSGWVWVPLSWCVTDWLTPKGTQNMTEQITFHRGVSLVVIKFAQLFNQRIGVCSMYRPLSGPGPMCVGYRKWSTAPIHRHQTCLRGQRDATNLYHISIPRMFCLFSHADTDIYMCLFVFAYFHQLSVAFSSSGVPTTTRMLLQMEPKVLTESWLPGWKVTSPAWKQRGEFFI